LLIFIFDSFTATARTSLFQPPHIGFPQSPLQPLPDSLEVLILQRFGDNSRVAKRELFSYNMLYLVVIAASFIPAPKFVFNTPAISRFAAKIFKRL
jgi:hypothetical protein